MARVGRLAGALLARSGERWFLVGNPKEPYDFAAAGWVAPGVIDAMAEPYRELESRDGEDPPAIGPHIEVDVEGEALARLLHERMVIHRNGSVSERLWRLVVGADDFEDEPADDCCVDARWLAAVPDAVWQAVRESVLRCV